MFFKFEICRTSATSPYVEDMFSHDERYDADVYGTASAWPETIGPATTTMPAVFREDVARALMDSGLTGMKFVLFAIGHVRSKKLSELPRPRYFALLPQGTYDFQCMIYKTEDQEPGLHPWQKPRNAVWTPADGRLVEKGRSFEAEQECKSRYKATRHIPVCDSWDGSDFAAPAGRVSQACFYCSERAVEVLRELKVRGVFISPCDALSLSGEGFAAAKLPWPPGPECYRFRIEGGPPLGLTPQQKGSPIASVLTEEDKADPSKILWFTVEADVTFLNQPVLIRYSRLPDSNASHEPCSTEVMTIDWLKGLLPAAIIGAEEAVVQQLHSYKCSDITSVSILLEHAEMFFDRWVMNVNCASMNVGLMLVFEETTLVEMEANLLAASSRQPHSPSISWTALGTPGNSGETSTCTFSFAQPTLPD